MKGYASVQERPNLPPDERASHELILRILKLRWMGLEREAERVEISLRRVDPECTLLAGPFDTELVRASLHQYINRFDIDSARRRAEDGSPPVLPSGTLLRS